MIQRVQVRMIADDYIRRGFPDDFGKWFTLFGFSNDNLAFMTREDQKTMSKWKPNLFNWEDVRLQPKKEGG